MPYRRLPNTDEARIRSLKLAVERHKSEDTHDLVFSFKTLEEAKIFLSSFERARLNYKQAFQDQVKASKNYQKLVKNARLFISHFIQVLNLSVIRDEIKPELKLLYGLTPENYTVPDMSTDSSVLEWGGRIVEGEQIRLNRGGLPIYNPAIAKVKVHHDLFKEAYYGQKIYQQTTVRMISILSNLRKEGDEIIIDLWNQIEAFFNKGLPEERIENCKNYGVIYYYRKGEKTNEVD